MSANKNKGPIYDPGVCRCCGGMKKCRLLNAEYECLGQKEIYSDMFVDCFGLMLSHLEGVPEDRLICATCVVRLREANSFRQQVLKWEEKLLQTNIRVHGEDYDEIPEIKVEVDIKNENYDSIKNNYGDDGVNDDNNDDDGMDNNDDDHDDHPDDEVVQDEEEIPEKKSKRVKSERKSVRQSKPRAVKCSSKKNSKEYLQSKKDLLRKMKETKKKFKKVENELLEEERPKLTASRKTVDLDQKAFQNTVIVVENSYVCPFDSTYSDYYCVYCRDIFTDPQKLRDHNLTHDPTQFQTLFLKKTPQIDVTRVDCRLCPQKIEDIDSFKFHITSVHGKFLYDVTNEFLKYRLTLCNLSCTECNAAFPFFHALKKHMAEHFGTCICDVCGAHYFEERMLDIHQKTHQRRVDENFPCKECGKNFKSKHSRYLHTARTHKKEPAYQCNKCDEVLFSYALRYRHMIEVHGQQRLFPCEHCDRTYDTRKSLREHNRRTHLKIFKHQCDQCDKRFYLPCRLKEHLATHTGERNFRCEYCGKSYPRLRGLKVHMQSHESEKKYKCMLCNASFTQNVNLKNHMKKQHQSLDVEESFQSC